MPSASTRHREFWRQVFYAFIDRPLPVRWERGEYCCDELESRVADQCDWALRQHPYGQCPDQVVVEGTNGFMLPIQDGGGSGIVISHCPWCGRRLPKKGFKER